MATDKNGHERSFGRSYDSLREIFAFIEEYFVETAINRRHQPRVGFVVEELFTNMVKYNPGNTNDILIRLQHQEDQLTISLTDFDVEPFNINEVPEVDVDRPLEERQPGGLGIHLIKKLVDRIEYDYTDRRSTTTLIKKLEP